MNTIQSVIAVVIMVALFLFIIIVLPQFFFKRAMRDVVRQFRKQNAIDPASAKPLEEIGIRQRSLAGSFLRGRDYKPYVMNVLIKSQIVIMTEDERFYLDEATFAKSNLVKSMPKT